MSSVNCFELIYKLLTGFGSAGSDPVSYTSTSCDLAQGTRGAGGGRRVGGGGEEDLGGGGDGGGRRGERKGGESRVINPIKGHLG